jgi:hypothetical protein
MEKYQKLKILPDCRFMKFHTFFKISFLNKKEMKKY